MLIIAVHYKSPNATVAFLESVRTQILEDNCKLHVIIVDNDDIVDPTLSGKVQRAFPSAVYLKSEKNIGYFGAAQLAYKEYQKTSGPLPEYIIVSNVDVWLKNDFVLADVFSKKFESEVGVIGPDIFSTTSKKHLNPYLGKRMAKSKQYLHYALSLNYYLYNLYIFIRYFFHRYFTGLIKGRKDVNIDESVYIYAAHGSMIIFTKKYFELGGNLQYGGFLFGEETFVAESCNALGLKVLYDPTIRVLTSEHVSTGKIFRSYEQVMYMRESYRFVINRYYNLKQ